MWIFLNIIFWLISIATVANTAQYEAASKTAKGRVLQAGHTYAFTVNRLPFHKRLIVGKVTGTTDDLDFSARVFEMEYEGETGEVVLPFDPEKAWDCTRGLWYTFGGEVDPDLEFINIHDIGNSL